MSCLKLYAPDECEFESVESDRFSVSHDFESDEPEIVSLSAFDRGRSLSLMEILARTRAVYQNKRCRDCGRPTVEPLERDDAMLGKNRDPIPGSATLVGFSCRYCRNEWPL